MRYINLPIIENNKKKYLSTLYMNIPIDKFEYKVIKYHNERLDALADKYYNDGTLWWIIASINKITNPFIIEKEYLLIPSNPSDIIDYIMIQNKK
jgi:hypothetical protein